MTIFEAGPPEPPKTYIVTKGECPDDPVIKFMDCVFKGLAAIVLAPAAVFFSPLILLCWAIGKLLTGISDGCFDSIKERKRPGPEFWRGTPPKRT